MPFAPQKMEEQRWKAQITCEQPCLCLVDPRLVKRDAHAYQRGVGKQHNQLARPEPERRRRTPPHALSLHAELRHRALVFPVHQREYSSSLALSLGTLATAEQKVLQTDFAANGVRVAIDNEHRRKA